MGEGNSFPDTSLQHNGLCEPHFQRSRPFPVCASLPRTTWVQGFSHSATKIKVDDIS